MMKREFIDKVFAFTQEKSLFSAPCHVVLGLSGGADSMALLHTLIQWPALGLRISAVHIHHGLRGVAADADEQFVRDCCDRLGVPLKVVHVDVASVARERKLSVEAAGRMVRYAQFEEERLAVGADYILTAHTASDQTETVLMHLIRGCGIDGLSGIPCVRDRIRRPLLCCNRSEIEEFCVVNAIPFVTDASNFDTKYTRNDLRQRVMPLLKEMNPSLDGALLRLSKCAAEESAYLNELAVSALEEATCDGGYRADGFVVQHTVIRRRMIRLLLRESGISTIQESHIMVAETVVLNGHGLVDLPDLHVFSVQQGVVSIRRNAACMIPSPIEVDELPSRVTFSGQVYSLEVHSYVDQNVHKLFLNCAVDYDKIHGKLHLRCRNSGDYFHAVGRGVGKSLKKWMNEWCIPTHMRDSYPLLCDDVGVILVPGYACDERVRITEDTKHFLVCKTDAEQG